METRKERGNENDSERRKNRNVRRDDKKKWRKRETGKEDRTKKN